MRRFHPLASWPVQIPPDWPVRVLVICPSHVLGLCSTLKVQGFSRKQPSKIAYKNHSYAWIVPSAKERPYVKSRRSNEENTGFARIWRSFGTRSQCAVFQRTTTRLYPCSTVTFCLATYQTTDAASGMEAAGRSPWNRQCAPSSANAQILFWMGRIWTLDRRWRRQRKQKCIFKTKIT